MFIHSRLNINPLAALLISGIMSLALPSGVYYWKHYHRKGQLEDVPPEEPLSAIEMAFERYSYSIKNLDALVKGFAGTLKVRDYFANVGSTKDEIQKHLRLLTCRDLLNISAALGHSYESMDRFEAIGIWYFLLRSKIDGVSREDVVEPTGKARAMFLSDVEEAKGMQDPGLVSLALHLQKIDVELRKQYMLHLYEYASVLANIDKTLTSSEVSFLNNFKMLQVSKDIDNMPDSIIHGVPNSSRNSQSSTVHRAPLRGTGPKHGNTSFTKKVEVQQEAPKDDSEKKLMSLIGLANVKAEIKSVKNLISVQQARVAKGLQSVPVSYHYVFTGNPGTGKTTVARILADIYRELGVLTKGQLVECDRAGLVAGYVGQTAIQTNKKIDEALDGVLFIDEAYSLASDDFGKEAINTLLKRMEDDRDRLVVILAGYTGEMQKFMDTNPGLQSRFNHYIDFPDYSGSELLEIFERLAKKQDYTISDDLKEKLSLHLKGVLQAGNENFGNARYVRNLFEKAIIKQANRLATKNLSEENLTLLVAEDLVV